MRYDPRLIMAYPKTSLHRAPADCAQRPAFRGALRMLALTCILGAGFALSGCPYRLTIVQGNILERETIDQVQEGMTRSQVQFLLGTPLIDDPFHADRWDYTYYIRRGRSRTVSQRWLTVYFEDGRVARLVERAEVDGVPEESRDTAAPAS